jgi:hypothetical protein
MAMKRRHFLLTLPFFASACATSQPASAPHGYVELAKSVPSSKSDTVLVLMPATKQTGEVWTGLRDELADSFRLVAVRIDGREGSRAIDEAMRRHQPKTVVLMNNPTVIAYRDYQRSARTHRFPPSVIVMTSFLEGSRQKVEGGATGISYEVPLITVVTNLRRLLEMPIERVGVVFRAPLGDFVRHQAELARREHIDVNIEELSGAPNSSELKRALRSVKRHSDALWVLNDDRLLTPDMIADGWLPGLNERRWVPAIVGAASLVSPLQSLGTFAVLPDHTALGVQAANLVFDIAGNAWELPPNSNVELPLSTTTTVDLAQVRERFSLRKDALSQVDRILE